jgi:putative ABC transport system permease protein
MNNYSDQKIPLASKMLLHKKKRLVLSLLGIAFSVVIMFMEIGFFNGINDSQSNLLPLINADLLLINSKRFSMLERNTLPRVRLSQASVLNEVAETIPLYEAEDHLRNSENKRIRTFQFWHFRRIRKALCG